MESVWPTRTDGEVFLPIAPFSHIYGFVQGVLVPLSARDETVIPERFQPEHIVELRARYRVTFLLRASAGDRRAIYAAIPAAHNLQGADLSALRMCAAGGAPFPVELMEHWRRATGLEIYEGYGMSEMAPISGANEGPAAREIVEKFFVGERALFCGESALDQRDFKNELTFPGPEDPGRTIFAHWHGKISHRFFRMHFEWPLPASARNLKIIYLGPKHTKD